VRLLLFMIRFRYVAALGLLSVSLMAQQPWMDRTLSPDRRAELLLGQMTLDEKIGLVHGYGMPGYPSGNPADAAILQRSNGGAGFVPGIPRLGWPDLNMVDASYGVARGAARSRYSTAMPSNLAAAASWDTRLAQRYGALIGRELRDQGYNMALSGGLNLMREPRNGRNFEYLGEDPILAGKMAAQFVRGIQQQNVIANLKHFALNDQESGRHVANVVMDKRTMRETDLLAFEIAVRDGRPGAVMCSYNKVNGDYACENRYLLTDLLKKEWNFPGFVISDWGGTNNTAKAALAGLDHEQPASVYFGAALKKAVDSGEVPAARLDDMVRRIARSAIAAGVVDYPLNPRVVDVLGGFELAQRFAEQGMVLLKNARGTLPINGINIQTIVVIGSHADAGVLSGGGSAQVDAPGGSIVAAVAPRAGTAQTEAAAIFGSAVWFPSSPLAAIRAQAPNARIEFNAGTNPATAAAMAKGAEAAIVFVHQVSTEGDDPSLALSGNQDELVRAVAAANPRTIVVLETGGPVLMPWADQVPAILEAWYPGIRGGEAIANVLFGDVNPSGKLPVTFPRSEADLPQARVPGPPPGSKVEPKTIGGLFQIPQPPPFDIHYTEGLKVGYKWYDAENKQPLFPFGHGLSYTTFTYSAMSATLKGVTFTITNTGRRAGNEVVQVYAGLPSSANEPPRRLVAWDRIQLAPGQARTVTIPVDPFYLSIFNADKDAWELPSGEFKFWVGASSRNTPLTATVANR
jgi:beta-glucosidase